jgi:hypothetical protein
MVESSFLSLSLAEWPTRRITNALMICL